MNSVRNAVGGETRAGAGAAASCRVAHDSSGTPDLYLTMVATLCRVPYGDVLLHCGDFTLNGTVPEIRVWSGLGLEHG